MSEIQRLLSPTLGAQGWFSRFHVTRRAIPEWLEERDLEGEVTVNTLLVGKTALGPVVYHADRCIGCRYCMQACPFQVPTYEWDKFAPRVRKCDLCYERQMAGT